MKTITAPTIEPVSLDLAKAHLKVTDAIEDTLISLYIKSARETVEHRTGRSLITQTLEFSLDDFAEAIELPMSNVSEIVSVKYINTSGVETTLAPSDYYLDSNSLINWIIPAYATTFPETLGSANGVTVRFIAGYGATADLVPANVITWMLLAIGSMYAHRESVSDGQTYELPKSFCDGLLDSVRTWRI